MTQEQLARQLCQKVIRHQKLTALWERAQPVKALSPSLPTSTAAFIWINLHERANTTDLLQIHILGCVHAESKYISVI